METPSSLEIHPAPHPSLEVHRAGFPLDHPYFEHCWTPILGPSSVMVLRRAAWLWRDQTPAVLDRAELAGQFGLGRSAGSRSPISRTLQRIVRFRFAEWSGPDAIDIDTEVRLLRSRDLEHVPAWCAARHDEHLTNHLETLRSRTAVAPSVPAQAPVDLDPASQMSQRLDQFAAAQSHRPDVGLSR